MKRVSSYRNTAVHWGKSQANICKLLGRYNISDIRFTFLQSRNELVCEFNYPTTIENKDVNIGVRILLPLPKLEDNEKEREKAKNQIHRALFYYLKTKFEALEFGLVEFMQEFMPHLVVLDKNGSSRTLYQLISPQYHKGLIKGEQGEISMLPEKIEK